MNAPEGVQLQGVALHAALWSRPDPEPVLDAIDDGTWQPEHFTDPAHRTTAQAILDVVLAGDVPWPEVVGEHLMAAGYERSVVVDMIDPAGAFEAAGFRLDGLPHWLALLALERTREAVDRRLRLLGNQLATPSGAQRAAEALGIEAA